MDAPWLEKDWRGNRRVLLAGDLAVEEPDLASNNFSKKEYAFSAGGDDIVATRPLSVRMIENLSEDPVTLVRFMSPDELHAWEDGDLDFLSVGHPRPDYANGVRGSIPEQVVWFSVGTPISFQKTPGTEMITIQIAKSKLLEWATKDQAVAGSVTTQPGDPRKSDMIEIAVTKSAWGDLAPVLGRHDGIRVSPEVSTLRKKERSDAVKARDDRRKQYIQEQMDKKNGQIKELQEEVAKIHFTSLQEALEKSGLTESQLEVFKRHSNGLLSVEDYLKITFTEGEQAIGLRYEGGWNYETLSKMKGLTKYADPMVSSSQMRTDMDLFLKKANQEKKPIVIFVPNNLPNTNINPVKLAVEWIMQHPEKIGNIRFVFGGSDLFSSRQWHSLTPREEMDLKITGLENLVGQ